MLIPKLAKAVEMEFGHILAVEANRKEQTMSSRWIDTEWLKQNFNTVFWSQITKTIDSAPSIDIVRCQDCKYWKESQYYPEVMACTYVKGATFTRQHDDFCSRGERESDE